MHMRNKGFEDKLEKEFHVSRAIIVYKFVAGIIELALGFGILFGGKKILEIYQNFKSDELLENPHDILVFILEKIIPYIFEHHIYFVLILLALGFVKVFGAIGLLYKKHWGLDLLVALTLILLPVDGFSILIHFTWGKLIYFLLNIFISLFLVNFNPKGYFTDFKKRTKLL